jgi:hypothetical protein
LRERKVETSSFLVLLQVAQLLKQLIFLLLNIFFLWMFVPEKEVEMPFCPVSHSVAHSLLRIAQLVLLHKGDLSSLDVQADFEISILS